MAHKEIIRAVLGSKYAVLMLHGILGTPDHFQEFVPLVPEDWSLHALLLEGHGGKVEDFSHSSMKRWKAQVFARLETLLASHEQVVIVAHSMGTLFAIQASLRYPGRIPALFLLGSPLRVFVVPKTAVDSVKMSVFGTVDPNDRSAVDMRRGCSVESDWRVWKYLGWIPRFLELFKEIWDTRKLLPQISVPTQVFQSKKDELVHPSSYKDFLGYGSITCTLLPDSGHFGYGDDDLALLKTRFQEMIATVSTNCRGR